MAHALAPTAGVNKLEMDKSRAHLEVDHGARPVRVALVAGDDDPVQVKHALAGLADGGKALGQRPAQHLGPGGSVGGAGATCL